MVLLNISKYISLLFINNLIFSNLCQHQPKGFLFKRRPGIASSPFIFIYPSPYQLGVIVIPQGGSGGRFCSGSAAGTSVRIFAKF